MDLELPERIRQIAQLRNLETVDDVFHSAESIEIRHRTGSTQKCLGFILGPRGIEVYRRRIDLRSERTKNRLWMIARFIPRRSSERVYEAITTWTYAEAESKNIAELIQEEFGLEG